jgi:hypothetical protein
MERPKEGALSLRSGSPRSPSHAALTAPPFGHDDDPHRSSVHCVALGRAGVHHWRFSRHW